MSSVNLLDTGYINYYSVEGQQKIKNVLIAFLNADFKVLNEKQINSIKGIIINSRNYHGSVMIYFEPLMDILQKYNIIDFGNQQICGIILIVSGISGKEKYYPYINALVKDKMDDDYIFNSLLANLYDFIMLNPGIVPATEKSMKLAVQRDAIELFMHLHMQKIEITEDIVNECLRGHTKCFEYCVENGAITLDKDLLKKVFDNNKINQRANYGAYSKHIVTLDLDSIIKKILGTLSDEDIDKKLFIDNGKLNMLVERGYDLDENDIKNMIDRNCSYYYYRTSEPPKGLESYFKKYPDLIKYSLERGCFKSVLIDLVTTSEQLEAACAFGTRNDILKILKKDKSILTEKCLLIAIGKNNYAVTKVLIETGLKPTKDCFTSASSKNISKLIVQNLPDDLYRQENKNFIEKIRSDKDNKDTKKAKKKKDNKKEDEKQDNKKEDEKQETGLDKVLKLESVVDIKNKRKKLPITKKIIKFWSLEKGEEMSYFDVRKRFMNYIRDKKLYTNKKIKIDSWISKNLNVAKEEILSEDIDKLIERFFI